ncbi:AAA family ATPase [Streptomyces californicus]
MDDLCGAQAVGGLLVFSGEAGLGKTALLAEIRAMAADRCTIWSARGGETVTSVPFHVVRQLLQPLDQFPPDEKRALFDDWYGTTRGARTRRARSRSAARPARVSGTAWTMSSPGSLRASATWPLLPPVDDAHWADGESLAWLSCVTARPR